ncbi:uncharacterized protein LOC120268722 isoform X1 [Dioscorea cayenensis subsp. rotundata]|uniref:Uncharacterized protein LOC120268722 isoform X1 n=1 Tax=Dioscorea cayennensis subsp. rotundata TaxID=55577 RepID=A0AB40BYJ0_DIOCR|nr:uncharacterized protein LOC120268722 isoform X1 [Dioscorea cayenensis subsp. rotundata]
MRSVELEGRGTSVTIGRARRRKGSISVNWRIRGGTIGGCQLDACIIAFWSFSLFRLQFHNRFLHYGTKMLTRQWMYNRNLLGRQGLTNEFILGVDEFIQFAINQDDSYKNGENIRCPCFKCKNRRFLHPNDITLHLYRRWFRECYWNWTCHGEEVFPISEELKEVDDQTLDHIAQEDEQMTWDQRMIYDCLRSHVPPMHESYCYDEAGPSVQPPLDESVLGLQSDEISQLSNRFFDILKAADQPLYVGCENHS